MKFFRHSILIFLVSILISSLFQCSSVQKLQEKAPFIFGEVYCQAWTGGIEEAGSGVNLFISVSSSQQNSIVLDSVYFRGKSAKFEIREQKDSLLYIGRFFSKPIRNGIVLSNDLKEEASNTVTVPQAIPFSLKENECVVTYKAQGETQYYKIENIIERPRNNYPSAPPKGR